MIGEAMTDRQPALDPATRYRWDLLALYASARDLLNDDGYAAVLPHLEALSDVLPDSLPVPRPAPRVETVGTDREATT